MPQDSAYIGVGEPVSRVTDALEKKGPMLEFAAMSRGVFTQVLSMAQRGMNPASNVDCAKFALAASRRAEKGHFRQNGTVFLQSRPRHRHIWPRHIDAG